jgi:hypothetical protein
MRRFHAGPEENNIYMTTSFLTKEKTRRSKKKQKVQKIQKARAMKKGKKADPRRFYDCYYSVFQLVTPSNINIAINKQGWRMRRWVRSPTS